MNDILMALNDKELALMYRLLGAIAEDTVYDPSDRQEAGDLALRVHKARILLETKEKVSQLERELRERS